MARKRRSYSMDFFRTDDLETEKAWWINASGSFTMIKGRLMLCNFVTERIYEFSLRDVLNCPKGMNFIRWVQENPEIE